MMLDANIALYTTDSSSPRFEPTKMLGASLTTVTRPVAISSRTLGAAVPAGTNSRAYLNPATGTEATARVYGEIAGRTPVTGNLVPDAILADFAGFPGLRWRNPLDDDMSGD